MIISLVLVSVSIFVLLRNNWVLKKQLELIDKANLSQSEYLSYDQMMLRFWIWDVEKLKKKGL